MDYLFQLGHFQAGDYAVEYVLVVLQEAALAVEAGDGTVHVVDDGVGYFVIFRGDDENAFGGIKACGYGVNHAGADEIGDEGVHGAVPAEYEACGAQDEEVEEHDDFPYGEGGFAVHPDGYDFRTVGGAAAFDDDAYADADNNAAEMVERKGSVVAGFISSKIEEKRERTTMA